MLNETDLYILYLYVCRMDAKMVYLVGKQSRLIAILIKRKTITIFNDVMKDGSGEYTIAIEHWQRREEEKITIR